MLLGTAGVEKTDPNLISSGEITMYGGEVRVRFDPEQHHYLVQDRAKGLEWFHAPSVTTILNRTLDKSRMLVPWATKMSMQTFLDKIEEGHLYTRAELDAIGYQLKDAHKVALDQAGKTGSAVHAWVEAYLHARSTGKGYPAPPTDPKVRSCCRAAREWVQKVDLKPIVVEKILYSRSHGFIGTTDLAAAAVIEGRSASIDWKSSNRLEASYALQLAAYQYMYQEMTGVALLDRWLIRLDKEDSTFEAKRLSSETAEDEQGAFILLAEAYKVLKDLGFFHE